MERYVTNIHFNNHWIYIRTKKKHPYRVLHVGRIKLGIISYKIIEQPKIRGQ